MREVVVHGTVEVMSEQQFADRSKSLRASLDRMAERRTQRETELGLTEPRPERWFDADQRTKRRPLLSFSRRARDLNPD